MHEVAKKALQPVIYQWLKEHDKTVKKLSCKLVLVGLDTFTVYFSLKEES